VAFLSEVVMVEWPEVIGHWDSMLIACSLQKHRDHSGTLVNVSQRHAQNAMKASKRAPVADALSCAIQQGQDGFISP
jgi:hypothetical protein